jgi:predicted phage terminase large subunit-like protein
MIFCPPGAAKSTYSSVQAVTLWMARNPHKNALCCSNTQDLAEAFNRRRRMVVETDEWQELAGTHLDPNNKGVKEFGLQAGGLSIAAGAGSSITGKRSHFNVADDLIIGHEQANSPTQLDKLWTWWMTDFRSRLVPRCPELVIMTRWSSGDIAGRLLDSKEANTWTVLRMPMECDDPPNDPLKRQMGEPLWPEWYEEDRVNEFKRNPRDWISLFQQRPVDEKGTWAPEEHLRRVKREDLPDHLSYIIGVDIALSVGSGDFTAFVVVGVDDKKNLYLVDVYREQVSPEVSARKFLDLCQRYKPIRAIADDDNATKVWSRYVFDMGRQLNIPPTLQLRPMRGQDKEVRASAFRGYVLSDQFHLLDDRPWTLTVIEEMLNFPSAATHDDVVDGLGLVGREMATVAPAHVPKAPTIEELGSPVIDVDGIPHLNMPLDKVYNNHDNDTLSISRMYQRGW